MKTGMHSVVGAVALALLLTSPASAGRLVTPQDGAAQTTAASTATPSSDPQLAGVVPQGREIPVSEAEQLRGGGKIKVAVVILRQGRNLVTRVIDCTSSSACRNEAARRFGKGVVEAVFYDTLLGAAKKQACRSGFRSAC